MSASSRSVDSGAYLESLRGRHAAVVGVGVSNVPLIRFLCRAGVKVTAFDKRDSSELKEEIASLQGYGVEYRLGQDTLIPCTSAGSFSCLQGLAQTSLRSCRRATREPNSARRSTWCSTWPDARWWGSLAARQDHNNHSGWQDAGAARKRPRARPAGAGGRQHQGPLVEQVLDVEPDDLIVLELSSFQLKPLRVSGHRRGAQHHAEPPGRAPQHGGLHLVEG